MFVIGRTPPTNGKNPTCPAISQHGSGEVCPQHGNNFRLRTHTFRPDSLIFATGYTLNEGSGYAIVDGPELDPMYEMFAVVHVTVAPFARMRAPTADG